MFKDERVLTRWLIKAVGNCDISQVKRILHGDSLPNKPYGELLEEYFGSYAPMIIARPDVVLIVEDYKRLLDEWFLMAIELKYFREIEKRRWREAYREIGQGLRYLMYGFDSAVLWHIFKKDIDDAVVKAYSDVIGEVIEKLELPIAYFSTKIINETKGDFAVLKPLEPTRLVDICYVITWMINCCRDTGRNPLIPDDKEIVERRRVLKAILKVP